MSEFSTPPPDVPDADWAEQQEEADPARADESSSGDLPIGATEADEGDLAEQRLEVFTPDDEE